MSEELTDLETSAMQNVIRLTSENNHLKKRIKELEAQLEWKPIKDAPRDGAKILLFTDSRLEENWKPLDDEHFTAVQIGYWRDRIEAPFMIQEPGWVTELVGVPTHWRPLPTPPQSKEGGE